MLRILVLSSRYPDAVRPYLGSFVEQLVLRLASRPGVELEVVAPIAVQPFPFHLRAKNRRLAHLPMCETWKGVRVHRPRYTLPPRMGWIGPPSLEHRLADFLPPLRGDFPFDVIAAQFFWPDGPAAVRIGRRLGVPVSVKARGHDVEPARWRRSRRLILEAGRGASGLLAVSEPLRERMIAMGMPAGAIAVHHTGLDRTLFTCRDRAAAKAALGVEGPLLLWVGNLIARKRPLLAIETLARIPDATLLIAGAAGPERQRVEAAVAASGLEGRVRLLGHVPPVRMAQLYAAADVTLHTAVSEGLANVWVESVASGTPIVVAELEAARPLLANGRSGCIAAAEPDALASAVRAILEAPCAPEKVAEAAEPFSWDRSAARMEAHLRALVALHRNSLRRGGEIGGTNAWVA